MISTLHHLIPRYQAQINLENRNQPLKFPDIHLNPSKTQIYYILPFQRRRRIF
ncbi:unnamed protein product [Meloidogyne enterolobii]|uniref:Uncharacterized protein n=1 Tax=Meloidogyne enterolobii TaxID=390850 RepID=A0ACB1AJ79_MELEN